MSEKFEFRAVFNEKSVEYTANNIKAIHQEFLHVEFIKEVMNGFEALSFGARCTKITDTLHTYLPKDFTQAVTILIKALGEEIQEEELEGYDGFYVMPLSEYVATYAKEDDFDIAMNALYEMTKRFSSEFAIRTFLKNDEEKTLNYLISISNNTNVHVRRLVSEGSRPRLPLGSRLHAFIDEPQKVLTLLESLKNEPSRLVQRSIANNLNDIAKDNPDICVEFLAQWEKENITDVDYIIKHATRTLIKEAHQGALKLLGFNPVNIADFSLHVEHSTIRLGEYLDFKVEFTLDEVSKEKLVIDFILHFKKANGKLSPKVFKLRTKEFTPKETITLHKRHLLKEASTRKYYEGEHLLEIQINGKKCLPQKSFKLLL